MSDNIINGAPKKVRRTRVKPENMEPLERILYNIGMDVYGLLCVNPECNWQDLSIVVDDYVNLLGRRCPVCATPLQMPMNIIIDSLLLHHGTQYTLKHGATKLTRASMIIT